MRINAANHLVETDKDIFGGRYPDEPKTGTPGVMNEDYEYLNHVYTKDQEETYDLLSQFRDVFDAITLRDNLTRLVLSTFLFV